jgi:hypothetical protein
MYLQKNRYVKLLAAMYLQKNRYVKILAAMYLQKNRYVKLLAAICTFRKTDMLNYSLPYVPLDKNRYTCYLLVEIILRTGLSDSSHYHFY